jgi:hypothetical protein
MACGTRAGWRPEDHRMKPPRNPDSAPGDWYIDTACIDCGASRHVAPALIVERNDKSVFARQPNTQEERLAAWRALLVCPTACVRSETKQARPRGVIFPQEITGGVWRCGFNARSSFGAHSYFAARSNGLPAEEMEARLRALIERMHGGWGRSSFARRLMPCLSSGRRSALHPTPPDPTYVPLPDHHRPHQRPAA